MSTNSERLAAYNRADKARAAAWSKVYDLTSREDGRRDEEAIKVAKDEYAAARKAADKAFKAYMDGDDE